MHTQASGNNFPQKILRLAAADFDVVAAAKPAG
jgi:hypothetical protein